MNNYNLWIIIVCFCCSTFLFAKAAGTLDPGKLNIISYVYYLFMLQTFVGISLIMLGYDKHYTISYLINKDKACNKAFLFVMLTAVLMPLIIILIQKLFKVNARKDYQDYLSREMMVSDTVLSFEILLIAAVICGLLLIAFLIKIGYIPVLRYIIAPSGFSFALERERIADIYVIHPYVTNILVLSIIPIISYMVFSYAIALKEKKWYFFAGILFILAAIVKTYKFEKSPLIFHLLVYVLIYIYKKGGIKKILMIGFAGIMGGILVLTYIVVGYSGSFLDIYNGPIGRTIFTQVGTLTYVFDLFPQVFGFLAGRSFSPTVLKLIGMDSNLYIRSAKLVMEYYGSEKVYDGIAGVMNTVFIGEAYANWGIKGILFSIVWVAFIISLLFILVLKLKKTPIMVAFFAVMAVKIGTVSQGGFVDFIYSFDLIMTCIIFLGGYLVLESDCLQNTRKIFLNRITKMSDRICNSLKMRKKK